MAAAKERIARGSKTRERKIGAQQPHRCGGGNHPPVVDAPPRGSGGSSSSGTSNSGGSLPPKARNVAHAHPGIEPAEARRHRRTSRRVPQYVWRTVRERTYSSSCEPWRTLSSPSVNTSVCFGTGESPAVTTFDLRATRAECEEPADTNPRGTNHSSRPRLVG